MDMDSASFDETLVNALPSFFIHSPALFPQGTNENMSGSIRETVSLLNHNFSAGQGLTMDSPIILENDQSWLTQPALMPSTSFVPFTAPRSTSDELQMVVDAGRLARNCNLESENWSIFEGIDVTENHSLNGSSVGDGLLESWNSTSQDFPITLSTSANHRNVDQMQNLLEAVPAGLILARAPHRENWSCEQIFDDKWMAGEGEQLLERSLAVDHAISWQQSVDFIPQLAGCQYYFDQHLQDSSSPGIVGSPSVITKVKSHDSRVQTWFPKPQQNFHVDPHNNSGSNYLFLAPELCERGFMSERPNSRQPARAMDTICSNKSVNLLKVQRKGVDSTSIEPQSIAARARRRRISDRIKVLGQLIPRATKLDTSSMFDQAIKYVQFLHAQLECLENEKLFCTSREDTARALLSRLVSSEELQLLLSTYSCCIISTRQAKALQYDPQIFLTTMSMRSKN